MADLRELIARLANFRTRSVAMDQLLLEGPRAVVPLIEALSSPLEGIRWAAATVLGRLGDAAALEPLRRLREDAVAGDAARKAIHAIRTATSPMAAAQEKREALSNEEILEALTKGQPITLSGNGPARTLRVPLAGGRTQRVRVDFGVVDDDGEPLVVAFTACGPARPERHEEALRYNMKMRFGAVGLVDIGGKPTFVMVDTHRRAGLDVASLQRSVRELAAHGDAMEKALTGEDRR